MIRLVKAKSKSKAAHPKRARKKPERKKPVRRQYKTISISHETHQRLMDRMVYADTFDVAIERLLDTTPTA